MSDPINVDVIVYKDGDNLILQSRQTAPVRIRLAFVDTGVNNGGEGQITALIQGDAPQAEFDQFLEDAKQLVENFIHSGGLDRERENIRLRAQVAELTAQA